MPKIYAIRTDTGPPPANVPVLWPTWLLDLLERQLGGVRVGRPAVGSKTVLLKLVFTGKALFGPQNHLLRRLPVHVLRPL